MNYTDSISILIRWWLIFSFRKTKIGYLSAAYKLGPSSLKKKLASQLLELRGIPAKFAQIRSMVEDENQELWKEAIEELEPLSLEDIEEILRKENPLLLDFFQFVLENEPKPASIGQVHKLKLKHNNDLANTSIDFHSKDSGNNREYALKIQYPGIDSQLLQDTELLGVAGRLFSLLKEGFALQSYQETLGSELAKELDYIQEAEWQDRFFNYFSNKKNIIIPKVYNKYSTARTLIQDWIPSIPALEFLEGCSDKDSNEFSDLIVAFYLSSFFELGLVHTDPNPGNFGILKKDQEISLVVYDFGSVYELSSQEKIALWSLLENQIELRWDNFQILGKLGFDLNTLQAIQENLSAYLSVILEPFLVKTRYPLKIWNRKERCNDILGENKLQFMISASSKIFPLLRAFQGLFFWCSKSSNDIWAFAILEEIRGNLRKDLDAFTLSLSKGKFNFSTTLCIEVWNDGKNTVNLKFARQVVENLKELIEPKIMEKINQNGIQINEIILKARREGYKPMNLLEWEDGVKRIRIFLE